MQPGRHPHLPVRLVLRKVDRIRAAAIGAAARPDVGQFGEWPERVGGNGAADGSDEAVPLGAAGLVIAQPIAGRLEEIELFLVWQIEVELGAELQGKYLGTWPFMEVFQI